MRAPSTSTLVPGGGVRACTENISPVSAADQQSPKIYSTESTRASTLCQPPALASLG